jgi:hypothetical protein
MLTVVRHKSGTMAINVHFHFEHGISPLKNVFPFPVSPTKIISHYFDNKRCGSNKTFLLITRQFIYALNLQSVKRDSA